MILEQEAPPDEEGERLLMTSREKPTSSSSLTGRHKKNRTFHIILLILLVSLAGIIGLFVREKNDSAEGYTVEKDTNGAGASAIPKTVVEIAENTSQILPITSDASDGTIPRAERIPAGVVEPKTKTSNTAPTNSDTPAYTENENSGIYPLSQFGSEEYIQHLEQVVERAMSAIRDEYGQSNATKMFDWDMVDLPTATEAPENFQKRGDRGNGGWTTQKSWKGLILRLLQSMSLHSEFTVVLAGHSAAAGHGNHFHQSYLMQFHKVMKPIFRQLGVNLVSRNQAQGGLGTIQSSLGFNSIYGSDIDLMLWDSGMTENNHPEHIDLFFRQALMVEGRVPVVWGAGGKFDLLKMYNEETGADIGEYGIGWSGIPETKDENQLKALPWATQHLKCDDERPDLCKHPYKFCATCWIDRPDKIYPAQRQYDAPHGQVRWHPGWRQHQLQGRVLAFALLKALKDSAILLRKNKADVVPNMTTYYDNIRSKVKTIDPSLGSCYSINTSIPERICRTPMKGRTQYTPRQNPQQTSVSSLLRATPDGYIPRNTLKPLYRGMDAHNPCFDLPEGAVDVVARVTQNSSSAELRQSHLQEEESELSDVTQLSPNHHQPPHPVSAGPKIAPGRGWQIFDEPQGECDGTYDSICAKSTRNRCVLYGHHDERGSVLGSDMSGWLVMEIPRRQLQSGLFLIKLHTWYEREDNSRTIGWITVNNLGQKELEESKDTIESNVTDLNGRRLGKRQYETPELGESFRFEFAIDEVITSWNRSEFLTQKQNVERVVELVTLLDDKTFLERTVSQGETLEVAIRFLNCQECVFGVSHVYWS